MRKLKIAFISSGTNNFITPYIEWFQKNGHQVYLISCDTRDADAALPYPVIDISFGAHGRRKSSKWRYLLSALKIRRVLKQIKPDILHGHYITSAGVISRLSGFRPYVLTAHGSDVIDSLRSRMWRFVLPKILRKAALINPVSCDLEKHLLALGVPQEKLFTATFGVDTEYFRYQPRLSSDGELCRLLCTRALGQVYDPQTIVRACEKLKERGFNFELTFAAGGRTEDDVKAMVSLMGLQDRIRFLNGYDISELPGLLHSHDIYVSASLSDGTSISLLEAMAAGIFPVVSRITANTALLDDGRTALMFECGNAEQLADAIVRISQNKALRVSAVEANRQIVVQKANRAAYMQNLEKKYYEVLE